LVPSFSKETYYLASLTGCTHNPFGEFLFFYIHFVFKTSHGPEIPWRLEVTTIEYLLSYSLTTLLVLSKRLPKIRIENTRIPFTESNGMC